MSAPVGPTGCHGGGSGVEAPPWFVGATYGFFSTQLVSESRIRLEEDMVSVSGGWRTGDLTIHGNVGAILRGTVETAGRTFTVEPGWLVSASVSRRWLLGNEDRWFVTGTLSLGASSAPTREAGVAGVAGLGIVRLGAPDIVAMGAGVVAAPGEFELDAGDPGGRSGRRLHRNVEHQHH